MRRPILLATAASLIFATAAAATAPQFDTPARVAYLIDLSSGAVLYAKNADARMPPASMAKMMTTEVAFELIDKGQLPLSKMCTVRPETWQKWHGPEAGSTMFLSANEQVSVENLLKGIVTLSGNDASVVLAECIAGTEQAFAQQMNTLAHQIGVTNSRFCNANGWPDNGCTYVTARDLATLAARRDRAPPEALQELLFAPELHLGEDTGFQPGHHPVEPQPDPRSCSGRGRAQDRAHGRGGLRLHRLGRAERAAPDRSARRASKLECARAGIDSADPVGIRRVDGQAVVPGGSEGRHGQGPAGQQQRSAAGRAAQSRGHGAGGPGVRRDGHEDPLQGPIAAPIAKGQHVADLVITTGDTPPQIVPLVAGEDVGKAGFFGRIWLGFKQLIGMA